MDFNFSHLQLSFEKEYENGVSLTRSLSSIVARHALMLLGWGLKSLQMFRSHLYFLERAGGSRSDNFPSNASKSIVHREQARPRIR